MEKMYDVENTFGQVVGEVYRHTHTGNYIYIPIYCTVPTILRETSREKLDGRLGQHKLTTIYPDMQ